MARAARTLIAFLYHESTRRQHGLAQQQLNLEFFVRHGVLPAMRNPLYHFAIVLTSPCLTPMLPTGLGGALTVHDLNGSHGFEFINFKRFLRTRWCGGMQQQHGCASLCASAEDVSTVDVSLFDYFVLIPDTVRGPFLPNYVRHESWPDLLTSQLSERVKLVGPSINCHGCDREPLACRTRLHSEGHLMATDRVGLRLLTNFWKRPAHKGEAIGYNEMGSSKTILDAGYNLGSLELFWRDHDFQDQGATSRKCALLRSHARVDKGGLVSCVGCYWNDTDLSPLEILFVHRSVHFDKLRRREVGATRDYTDMHTRLAGLKRPSGRSDVGLWPARPWTWRGKGYRGRAPSCNAACPQAR